MYFDLAADMVQAFSASALALARKLASRPCRGSISRPAKAGLNGTPTHFPPLKRRAITMRPARAGLERCWGSDLSQVYPPFSARIRPPQHAKSARVGDPGALAFRGGLGSFAPTALGLPVF
jgi:hypothetical protein